MTSNGTANAVVVCQLTAKGPIIDYYTYISGKAKIWSTGMANLCIQLIHR